MANQQQFVLGTELKVLLWLCQNRKKKGGGVNKVMYK
jgi:hypothetical protein